AHPNRAPNAAQNTSWVPSDATRNSHSRAAGNPSGTSFTPGSASHAATTGTRKASTAAAQRAHGPPVTRLAVVTAMATASSPMTTIARYSRVRLVIVSGSPTAGGLAGYFRNGTTMTAAKAVPAAARARPPSDRGPTRPRSAAKTSANTPPTASP